MKDLGFGLVDQRSVLIVLFTFVVSNVVFGYAVPVDMSNATTAFVTLVILTGFIYFTRTLSRVLLVFASAVISFPHDYNNPPWGDSRRDNERRTDYCRRIIGPIWTERFVSPLFHSQEWHSKMEVENVDYFYIRFYPSRYNALGRIDRILLVGIAFVSTLPWSTSLRQDMGLIGIGVLILVYVRTGRFTFVLKDPAQKTEEQRLEQLVASKNPKINFPASIRTTTDISDSFG